MASALPTNPPTPLAPAALPPAQLANFRDPNNADSDASDSDQSDASGRSLSPTRQGLSKTKKRKERRQFGAFADELGDLLGAAFQSKDDQPLEGLAASAHAASTTDGDLDMQIEPAPTGPKLSRRARQNLERAQARKRAKEQSSMLPDATVAAERKGMTIQHRGQKPDGIKKSGDATKKRRSRAAREKLKRRVEAAGAMDVD